MLLCSVLALFCALVSSAVDRQYLNEWAVEIPGGAHNARSIADELGYKLVRQVSRTEHCVFQGKTHLPHTHLYLYQFCMQLYIPNMLCNAFIHSNTVAYSAQIIFDLLCRYDCALEKRV